MSIRVIASRLTALVLAATFVVPAGAAASARQSEPAPPPFDRETAMWLVTLPLACVGKVHEPPKSRGYIYESTVVLKPDFAKTRAFYGCFDWHSAVNSTWMMVKVLRRFPDLKVSRLIREKLNEHLSADAIKGELAFFSEEGNKSFERPYGYAWLLRLYGELRSWDDPDAKKWAANLEPLAKLLLERTIPYLNTLAAPMRVGTHANSAYALKLLLEYSRSSGEPKLGEAVLARSKAFFLADEGCAPNLEVSGSDFFSPCLTEAALMAEVLPEQEFARWLDRFLPAPDAPGFKALTTGVEMKGTNEELKKANMLGAKSHLIGLAVSRAKALEDIAAELPAGDPRIAAYRRIAVNHVKGGMAAMYDADYEGTHWIATYIVDYLVSVHRDRTSVGTGSK
jgi:hypothetical protein